MSARWRESDLVHVGPEARRQIAEQLEKIVPRETNSQANKPRKYRNIPAVVDGIRFDSKLEARCYQWHKERQATGEILWFVRQVTFGLPGCVRYRSDFLAATNVMGRIRDWARRWNVPPEALADLGQVNGVEVTDSKGILTPDSRNKIKQVRALYGVEVNLWPPR